MSLQAAIGRYVSRNKRLGGHTQKKHRSAWSVEKKRGKHPLMSDGKGTIMKHFSQEL